MDRSHASRRVLRLSVVGLVIGSLSSCLPESTSPNTVTSKGEARSTANRPPLLHDYYPLHGPYQDPYQGGGTDYAAFWIHPDFLSGCSIYGAGSGLGDGSSARKEVWVNPKG